MKKSPLPPSFFKIILVLALLFIGGRNGYAQTITNYGFTNTASGTFTPLTGATTSALTAGNTDDGKIENIPVGFDFWYMGTRYTTISASTNGWLAFGSTLTDDYVNSLANSGIRPVLAPLWDDLNVVAASNISYKTAGTAGSRIFTIQYLNVKWNYQALVAVASFQVNLYESTGRVEYIYRSDAGAALLPTASIGITATAKGTGNYLSVANAGTTVSSTAEATITTKRVTGAAYRFTPPVPVAPTSLTFTNVSGTSMTLNWIDNATNETGYVIYRSTDGTNYTFVNQASANATSTVQTGLTANTTYFWRVYAVTEGGLSTPLSGSRLSICAGPVISQLPSANLIGYYKFEGNASDATGNNNAMLQGSPASVADRFNIAGRAYTFNGTNQYISTVNSYVNPSPASTSVWFKTATTVGGALMGFSSLQTGAGGNRDRFLYMTSTGNIYAAVSPGSVKKTINSSTAYNDGNWHMATSTVGAGGLKLYVDGVLIATDATVTAAETTTGYWRIGYSDLSGWPNEPASYYFDGTLDDAIIYHKELSAAEIAILYNSPDGAGSNMPVCAGSTLNLSATTVSGATYSWTGPNSFTSSLQNPTISYTAANEGIYTVQITVAGCTTPSVAYARVISSTNGGQWTGNVSNDWSTAANWCSGVVPLSTTNVVIPAGATRMPEISTSVTCNNLTIDAGATLTTTATGTLNIGGTLTGNGTFTSLGTTNFNGTAGQQTFSGVSQFYNLTISNPSGLLLPGLVTVNNNLTIAAGTLNLNNFNISVKGNWVNNSSAAALTAGTTTVTFNGTTAQSIGGTFSTNFNNLSISGTANTVSLLANINIAGDLSVTSGTFDLGAFTANRLTSGGNLMLLNNTLLKIGGTNTYPVNYTTNTLVLSSTVEYSGTTQTVAVQNYGNLSLTSGSGASVKTLPATTLNVLGNFSLAVGAGTSVTATAGAAITVNGNVNIGASTTLNGGSFTHTINGNWTNNGTFTGNTSTVIFNGSGATVAGTGTQNFNHLTVAASPVTFANNALTLTGNLATTGSGAFSQTSGGTLTMSGTAKTITGTGISLDNLTISGSVTTAVPLTLTGNLAVSGSFTASAGTLNMSGTTKTISGAGTISLYILAATGVTTTTANFSIASSLNVAGSITATAGTATFTGTSSLNGTANLYNVTVNGTSLQLTANAVLGVANVLTLTAGTLNVSSSAPNTVNFNGTGAQNINGITYHNLILSNGNSKTAAAGFTTNGNFTIGTGTTFLPGANLTHTLNGDWINNGTFTAGSSTITFAGTKTLNITGATTFNIITVNTSTASTAVMLQNDISVATLNMTQGTMLTGVNTVTITTTRNGNGIILGTITRSHAFNNAVDYAFEGPNNTINFALPVNVNLVTVKVVQGAVSDFPFGGSISRLYTITANGGYLTAILRLHYEDGELNGNTEGANLNLWGNTGSGWSTSGSILTTTRDGTINYVQQSTIGSNLTGRWTISDNSNVVNWNGSVSNDWNTAGNWTVAQGSASRPPIATDIVNLGTIAFTNQPTINSVVSVRNINFGSVKPVTLTMAGGSLTSGDIRGTWSANATHTFNVNNQNVTINGDLSLSDGTTGRAINVNIGSGTLAVAGSFNQSGNASTIFSGAGNLNIRDNFNYTNGIFTPGTGTVTYNGATNQTIGNVAYNNLNINKGSSSIATNTNALTIGGNLVVTAGTLDNSGALIIAGNVTTNAASTFKNSNTLRVGGNWLNNGNYTDAGGTVSFEGTGTQTISATTFNNLTINKPVGSAANLTGNISLQGNLTVTSGTYDVGAFNSNRSVNGGMASVANAGTLIIGANNMPTNFSWFTLTPASTVIFNGTAAQTIAESGVTLGNVIFRNAGVKTLTTPVTVAGDLTIESGSTFAGGAQTINLAGNWTNNGTYTPGTSTVQLTGATKNIVGVTTFNKVTISGSYTQTGSQVTYNDLLNITTSGVVAGAAGITTIVNGDFTNRGTLNTSGTTIFSGTQLQTLSLINATTFALTVNFNGTVSPVLNSTSAPQFGFLNINNTGGVNPSVGWTINNDLSVASGASFGLGTSSHTLIGSLTNNGTITSSGVFNFTPTSAVSLNMGTAFSSTGTVVFGGTGNATLSGTPAALKDVIISNTNAAGITPSSNWTLSNNFTVGAGATFKGGAFTNTIAGNILNNGTMLPATSTFILNLAKDQTITNGAFNNLTVNKTGGTTTLLTNSTVAGLLTFTAGKITTGSNSLNLSAAASVTGAAQNTGWVNGNLKKNIITGATTKAFEIGDLNNYTPLSLSFNSVTSAGDLLITTNATDHPNLASSNINQTKSVNRYWKLTNSGVVFDKYSATLNFVAGDVDAGASTAAFGVGVYTGSSWILPAVTVKNATNITATNITVLGDLAIGEVCNAGTVISYAGSPYCTNSGNATVTMAGTAGGVFSSTPGLSIDASTGLITLANSAAGIYNVVYTVAAAGNCVIYSTSTTITVTKASEASMSYSGSPYYTGGGTASIDFSGTTGGVFSSTAGLTLNAATGDITLLSSTPGTYTVTYTVAAAGGCTAFSTTTSVTIVAFKTWDGGAGTSSWGDAVNWLPDGVPLLTDNLNLTGAFSINADVAAVANNMMINNAGLVLTIDPGKSLNIGGNLSLTAGTLNVNTGTLKLAGTVTNSGTITASNGAVEFNGTSAQTIPAATFTTNTVNNLRISNTAGVTLGGALNIKGILIAATGNLNSAGNLTLVSSATQTALIDGSGTGNVIGNVTMQRYLAAGFGYKYFSSPVTAATVNSFSSFVDLNAAFPNFYRYIENVAISGWTAYTSTSAPLVPLQGYAADFGPTTQPLMVSITGVVNNGAISATLQNHNQPYTLGFNLVGNPYPSPVNWDLGAGWTKTNIDNAIYFFDSGSTSQYTGTYCSYINGVSSDGIASPVIASMQGFFIHVSNGAYPVTGTLGLNNAARVNDLSPVFHKATMSLRERVRPRILLRLSAGFANEAHSSDPIVIYVADDATTKFDSQLDAIKFLNTNEHVPNFYSVSEGNFKLAINALPDIDSTTVIPLTLQSDKNGTIEFVLRDLENLPDNLYTYLFDAKTGKNHLMEKGTQLSISLNTGNYENRFSIRFSTTRTINDPDADKNNLLVYSGGGSFHINLKLVNDEKGDLVLTNMAGQILARKAVTGSGIYEIPATPPTGIYIISFITTNKVRSKKVFHRNE